MWNDRFNTPDYVFGTEPAAFLGDHADWLVPGHTALAVADGEGRNSVFMAERGLTVTAIDNAPAALAKARALAEARGVIVAFQQADLLCYDWPDRYDLVASIFIQFTGPAERTRMFAGMADSVRPGGVLMLHGYTPEQINHGTGGPRALENLYTAEMLRDAFPDWDVAVCHTHERDLQEGVGHSGRSALIDFIARKPA